MDHHTRLILESLFLLLRCNEANGVSGGHLARLCGIRADAINQVLREHSAETARFNGAELTERLAQERRDLARGLPCPHQEACQDGERDVCFCADVPKPRKERT